MTKVIEFINSTRSVIWRTELDIVGDGIIMQCCQYTTNVAILFIHINFWVDSTANSYSQKKNQEKITKIFFEIQLG